ncbi:MAG: FTR1 family iron permease [Zoogloeaceae bacterium]|jgi:high-affinity iron transporter|nr:FTR1 family iron permease [Zoogloeaceae bacterium]
MLRTTTHHVLHGEKQSAVAIHAAVRLPKAPRLSAKPLENLRACGARTGEIFFSSVRSLARALLCLCLVLFSAPLFAAGLEGARVIDDILARGKAAVAAYDETQPLTAAGEFSALYFERFEMLELDLGTRDSGLKNELEALFGALNGDAMRGVPRARLETTWGRLESRLLAARHLYGEDTATGASGTFVKALLILLREGAESLLVVGALAAWLRRAGAADRVWVIYAGVAVAIPLSLATGWAVTAFLKQSGAPLAVVEGITLLAASVMLFYVSCWLFAKCEAKRWDAWIARQMETALGTGSLLALAGTACLAVYREGAETVLFYQALALAAPGEEAALWSGLATAAVLLLLGFFCLRRLALKLPFGLFFGATSLLLYGLAIVFLGQGIVELQAAGWFASLYLPGFPQVSWLGIAPSAQSLGAQACLLLLPMFWFFYRRFFSVRKEVS